MKKFRSFLTVLFLLSSLIILLLIAIFDSSLYIRAADLIREYLLPAVFALVVFLILLSAGIVSASGKSSGSLFSNGYFQLAIVELFLCSAGFGYYKYYVQQPGQIIIRLQADSARDTLSLAMKYRSAGTETGDTIQAPRALNNLHAGNYYFEILV